MLRSDRVDVRCLIADFGIVTDVCGDVTDRAAGRVRSRSGRANGVSLSVAHHCLTAVVIGIGNAHRDWSATWGAQ